MRLPKSGSLDLLARGSRRTPIAPVRSSSWKARSRARNSNECSGPLGSAQTGHCRFLGVRSCLLPHPACRPPMAATAYRISRRCLPGHSRGGGPREHSLSTPRSRSAGRRYGGECVGHQTYQLRVAGCISIAQVRPRSLHPYILRQRRRATRPLTYQRVLRVALALAATQRDRRRRLTR
jgi:hypothetical protein